MIRFISSKMLGWHVPGARPFKRSACLCYAAVALSGFASLATAPTSTATPPLPGAIFTTNKDGDAVNQNIYASKDAVWLSGGPTPPNSATLPDGDYYVQVTTPSGILLGTTVGKTPPSDRPAHVQNKIFTKINLWDTLVKASDGSQGYDDTKNPGGEYKVWVSASPEFNDNSTKTDNFKIKESAPPPLRETLKVIKFYDANANGIFDGTDIEIPGWKVNIVDANSPTFSLDRFTPAKLILDPGDYIVSEYAPIESNWLSTTGDEVPVRLVSSETVVVAFGNLCLGAGGGLTLGFWSNKNGQSLFVVGDDLECMKSINLRDANGNYFKPSDYATFKAWLLKATATNMAYMLSAQLAAMKLNVINGKVNSDAIVYAPGTGLKSDLKDSSTSGKTLEDFVTIYDLMKAANESLGTSGNTTAGDPCRLYQEALKNALDNANNNKNFVLPPEQPFTFEP